jgi:hypothetical protein
VLSNVLAAAISDPADVTHFYEIGSGKVLAGLAKRRGASAGRCCLRRIQGSRLHESLRRGGRDTPDIV